MVLQSYYLTMREFSKVTPGHLEAAVTGFRNARDIAKRFRDKLVQDANAAAIASQTAAPA